MMRLGGDETILSHGEGQRHLHRFPSTLAVYERLRLQSPTREQAAHAVATRLQGLAKSLCSRGACPDSLLCGRDARFHLPLGTPLDATAIQAAITRLEKSRLLPADEAQSLKVLAKAA